jgi:hypothetical protein
MLLFLPRRVDYRALDIAMAAVRICPLPLPLLSFTVLLILPLIVNAS